MNRRVALVTGVSRGIGRATAERLLDEGCMVLGLARSASSSSPVHPNFVPVDADVTDFNSLRGTMVEIVRAYSDLEIVVSVAGRGDFGELEQHSVEQIRASMEMNLLSHMVVARHLVPHLKERGRGDVVFMGSEAGLNGARNGTLYCAAKFGLRGFAQSLRAECSRRGVRVGIVNPGMVRTSFFDGLNFRPGPDDSHAIDPRDVAEAVWMMVSARPGTVFDEVCLSPQRHVIRFGKDE